MAKITLTYDAAHSFIEKNKDNGFFWDGCRLSGDGRREDRRGGHSVSTLHSQCGEDEEAVHRGSPYFREARTMVPTGCGGTNGPALSGPAIRTASPARKKKARTILLSIGR